MYVDGVSIMRARLARLHPGESPEALHACLMAWLWTRPGAEHGDGVGVPRVLSDEGPASCDDTAGPGAEPSGQAGASSPKRGS